MQRRDVLALPGLCCGLAAAQTPLDVAWAGLRPHHRLLAGVARLRRGACWSLPEPAVDDDELICL